MSNLSLEASIRTCKVDTAWANKIESDRFLNPQNMLCPPWNGVDSAGRPACPDSYYTKTPGCNSASDRVTVENGLRPQYIEYVNLDAAGIRGGLDCGADRANADVRCGANNLRQSQKNTGNWGFGVKNKLYPNCVSCAGGLDAQSGMSMNMRNKQWKKEGFRSHCNRCSSGMNNY